MYTSHELFMALFLVLGLQTLREFKELIGLTSLIPYLLLPISLLLVSYYYPGNIILYIYLGCSLLVGILLAKDLRSTTNSLLLKKQKYIPTVFYIISGFVFLTLIPFSQDIFKPEIIVGVFVLIWCNDTFAYIIGKSLGEKKITGESFTQKNNRRVLWWTPWSHYCKFYYFYCIRLVHASYLDSSRGYYFSIWNHRRFSTI
jgi:phosphatidate cytidylyltransferase